MKVVLSFLWLLCLFAFSCLKSFFVVVSSLDSRLSSHIGWGDSDADSGDVLESFDPSRFDEALILSDREDADHLRNLSLFFDENS